MRIAIDAMGGDRAPDVNVEGAVLAAREWDDIEIILVGDSERIESLMEQKQDNISIRHADDVISADEEPARAVRRKKNASMVVAGELVKAGEADAMISAGNTGALMAIALLIIGRIEGIKRPALAPMIPTMDGTGILALDLGANMDAVPEELLQYALMGSIYRSKVGGIDKPRIGLLNVGTEEMKGNELTKLAYPLLAAAPINFVGNVEARGVLQGNCDVLVCDGFAGNILLKAMEGAADTIFSAIKSDFSGSFIKKCAASLLKPGLVRFKKKFDYAEHGGAPFLGVKGVCIKGHGSSDANAMMNAIRQARHALLNDLTGRISLEIGK